MANSVGRLWVAVDADVRPAMNALRALDAQVQKTSHHLHMMGGSRGSGTSGINATTAALQKQTQAANAASNSVRRTGLAAQSATKPFTALQASLFRTSQAFINLRYGNPIGTIAGLSQAASSARVAFAGMSGGTMGLVAALAALPVVAGAAGAALGAMTAKVGLEAAADFEMLRIQYTGLLGDAQRAQSEVQYLLDLGSESIVPTENLLEANRLLLAYGITADNTRRSLVQFMSDFGSATGITQGKLQDMAYALGQIESQGKANMIDLRQLANAGLNLADVYKAVAKQQGISVAQARNLTSEGKMTSAVLIPAIVSMGDKYSEAADQARDSVQGILANIKDIAKIKLGLAFEGLLSKAKPLLKWVQDFIKAFDFSKVSRAFGNVMKYFSEALRGVGDDAGTVAAGVSDFIANSVNLIGYALAQVASYANFIYQVISTVFNFLWAAVQQVVAGIGYAISAMAEGAAQIPGPWQDSARTVADSTWQMAEEASAGAAIAGNAWTAAAGRAAAAWTNMFNVAYRGLAVAPGLSPNGRSARAEDYYTPTPQKTPKVPSVPTPSGGGGGAKTDPALKKWEEWVRFMRTLIDDFKDAFNELRSLSRGQFGELSDIRKALAFGGEDGNYQGDVDQIIDNYNTLAAAVTKYYRVFASPQASGKKAAKAAAAERDSIIKDLNSQTTKLVILARENEQLQEQLDDYREATLKALNAQIDSLSTAYDADVAATEKYYDGLIAAAESALEKATAAYESANSKLQDMISERDDFLRGILDSARSFVSALSLTSEMITTFTRLDSAGSFLMEEKQKTASFKDQMQQRLQVMKEWAQGIKSLIARGLDGTLIRDLVAAGPEASGEIVKQLVGSDNGSLAEINSLQAELAATVGGLQKSISKEYFDAGIAAQAAYTAQQASAVSAAQASLAALQQQRQIALDALKADYEAKRKALEEQIAAVEEAADAHSLSLVEQMKKNDETASSIAESIEKKMAWLSSKKNPKSMAVLGKNAMEGMIQGLEAMEPLVVAAAERIANKIRNTIASALAINSPSRVMMEYGNYVGQGLAIGMESSLTRVEGASLRLASASVPRSSSLSPAGAPQVRVFIGDQELRDIVDVQIEYADARESAYVTSGRRL